MSLDVNTLKSSLTAIYTATTNTDNSTTLANAICNYLVPITPASTGVEGGRAQMITTFNSLANLPDGHILALVTALPVYASTIASGMSPSYTGTPPSISTLPNFYSLYKSLTDAEAPHADCATSIATAIHTWFSSGTATSTSDNTTINWGVPIKESVMQKVKNKIEKSNGKLSSEQKKAIRDENNAVKNSTETTAQEYAILTQAELTNNELITVPVDINNNEIREAIKNTPKQFRSAIGERIVAAAIKDLGVKEHADTTVSKTPTYRNYGGIPPSRPVSIQQKKGFPDGTKYQNIIGKGRIDEMLKQAGLSNELKSQEGKLQGYFWCAAAVTSWYLEAGADKPQKGPAAVWNWKNYGSSLGRYTKKPIIGSAVCLLYGAGHIGIVAAVIADNNGNPKKIMTIEGNTGSPKDRNGIYVAYKTISASSTYIDGYFNPAVK